MIANAQFPRDDPAPRHNLPGNDAARRERNAMLRWTAVITGMLLLGIFLSVGGAIIAVRGMPMVEEDYYNKALHWDDQVAQARASAALGWTADISVGPDATTAGDRALFLRLSDKTGAPVENATVSVAFFHRAHPLDLVQAQLKPVSAGVYASSVPLNRAGVWQFRISIQRTAAASTTGHAAPAKQELFVATQEKDLLE